MPKTHKVTVAGQYYTRQGRIKELANFEETFELTPNQWRLALNVIQNELIKPRLKQKDPAADGFRTCQIISGAPPKELLDDDGHDVFDDLDPDLDNMAAAEDEIGPDTNLETGALDEPEVPTKKVKKVRRKTSAKGRTGRVKE